MKNISRLELENIYGKISPFEFKNKLIELATLSNRKSTRTLLDAGRGNPNWIASTPREAFFTFGQFAITESRYTWDDGDLTGMPKKTGIYKRFCTYVENNKFMPGIDTLKAIIDYGIEELNFDKDEFLHELTDAIIGDNYPFPDRMLIHIEKIVKEYLKREMKYDVEKGGEFNVFAVEGATAAMCYIFDSLIANNLLLKGDKIAIMTPVFTPYLEIPHLPRYEFEVVYINADEIDENDEHTWQCSNKELEKLSNPDIKALFVVNPSNPPSVAISQKSISKIVDIVKTKNKDLMIISDDVYGTFIHGFRSLMADLPYNTIGVYSYSKYFGVTGWRLGVIALAKDNVYNKRIANHSSQEKERIRIRYASLTNEVEKLSFIDRIVADSRQVALNHTAGLSTPQQVQMAIFSIFGMLNQGLKYKEQTKKICKQRKELLYENLIGLPLKNDSYSTNYYDEYDLLVWARMKYGEEFAQYLKTKRDSIEFLFELAEKHRIVLLNGSGFEGPSWSIRVSLANLYDEQYVEIGKGINELFDEYAKDWKNSKK